MEAAEEEPENGKHHNLEYAAERENYIMRYAKCGILLAVLASLVPAGDGAMELNSSGSAVCGILRKLRTSTSGSTTLRHSASRSSHPDRPHQRPHPGVQMNRALGGYCLALYQQRGGGRNSSLPHAWPGPKPRSRIADQELVALRRKEFAARSCEKLNCLNGSSQSHYPMWVESIALQRQRGCRTWCCDKRISA